PDTGEHRHESGSLTLLPGDGAAGLAETRHDAAERFAAAGHDAGADRAAHATQAAEAARDVAADGAGRVEHAARGRPDAAADAGGHGHEAGRLTLLSGDGAARLVCAGPERAGHAAPDRVAAHHVARHVHRTGERIRHVVQERAERAATLADGVEDRGALVPDAAAGGHPD